MLHVAQDAQCYAAGTSDAPGVWDGTLCAAPMVEIATDALAHVDDDAPLLALYGLLDYVGRVQTWIEYLQGVLDDPKIDCPNFVEHALDSQAETLDNISSCLETLIERAADARGADPWVEGKPFSTSESSRFVAASENERHGALDRYLPSVVPPVHPPPEVNAVIAGLEAQSR